MLIFDDQPGVRTSLEYLLRRAGYRVLSAESGPAAIALAERESIEGALIDVHMPVMNGFDACVRLQAQATSLGRELRVWFMTGGFTSDVVRRGAELGALGVFAKPFDFSVFLARLDHGFASPVPFMPPQPASVDGQSGPPPP